MANKKKNSIEKILTRIRKSQSEGYVIHPTILSLDDYVFLLKKLDALEKEVIELREHNNAQ